MKKAIQGYGVGMSLPEQIIRAMKLTAILLTVFCLQVSANGLAQVTFSGKKIPLEKVFDAIKRQTEFHVVYGYSDLRDSRTVDLDVRNAPVREILDKALKDQPLEYSIVGLNIFIKRKTEKKDNTENGIFSPAVEIRATKITGRVQNQNSDPVPGATVTEKGTSNATSTAVDGTFELFVDNPNCTIIITGANVEPYEQKLQGQKLLFASVTMKISKLDEIQVVAYGTNTQRFNVGSVTKITSEEISRQPVGNPLVALQGRVPGLVVTQANGLPGSSVTMRIRGQNSLKSKTSGNVLFDNPLYIINGVPYAPQNNFVNQYTSLFGNGSSASPGSPGYSPFNSINPSDIESIEILRDADATAIYGSRGSNGVILITTKRGTKGKATINANVYFGRSESTRIAPLMNIEQYLAMRKEAFSNDNITPNLTPFDPGYAPDLLSYEQNRNANWVNTFIGGDAELIDANISISGGNENTQFLLGSGIRHETFILPGAAKNERFSVNANFHHNSNDRKLTIDFTSNYSFDKNFSPGNANLTRAFTLPPNYPELKDPAGNLIWNYKGTDLDNLSGNPFAYLLQEYRVKNYNLISNLSLGYQILSGITLRANMGYNNFEGNETVQFPKASQNPRNSTFGRANFGTNKFQSWIIEPQIDINKAVFNGRLNFSIGATFQKNINTSTDLAGTRYSNDNLLGTITGAGTITARDGYGLYKYNAFFGRLNYIWDNKYIANFTGRRDGSSRFGPSKQFGNFGSVGFGWIFSQEPIVQKIIPELSYAKLRITYGSTGNDNIGNYQYIAPYTAIPSINYQGSVGYETTNLFNPDFSWSITKKFETGLEFGVFKDKILMNFTYYNNRSGNQLVQYTLPIQSGFRNVTKNAPYEVSNTGFEFSFSSTNIQTKAFSWNTSFNLTIPKNKLIAFPGIEQSPYKNTYVVGKSLSVLKRYVYNGINDTTGLFQFKDLNKDGMISPYVDYDVIGDLDEDYYGGFSNDFSFKGFKLGIFFQFSKGLGENYLGQIYSTGLVGDANNLPLAFVDRWNGKGSQSKFQRLTTQYNEAYEAGSNFSFSNAAYGDASYIRLKTISISYDFPKTLLKNIKLQAARLFINAQNVLTITSYDGNDPESRSFYSVPLLKTIAAGFSLNF